MSQGISGMRIIPHPAGLPVETCHIIVLLGGMRMTVKPVLQPPESRRVQEGKREAAMRGGRRK